MNKVMIIGHLGADPELRYTKDGTPLAAFSVASIEYWKDSQGIQQKHTEWHRIVVWRRLADYCGQHLSKGDRVYIGGKNHTRRWEDKNGNTRYTTEIVASEVEMLSGNTEGAGSPPDRCVPPISEDTVPF